ncbi:3-oxoacyl-ACP synthase [bacterium endosymbiont of Pedicinus badii]|nr:3-oxoacyl-ACP synthase [bacterium endosymbiont of Pedicinus badii]
MITPLGNSVKSTWKNIINGKSGIDLIKSFDVSQYPTRFAGIIKNFNSSMYFSKKEAKKMDEFIQYGVAAGIQAIQDSGISINSENSNRIGISIGSGIGGLQLIEENYKILLKKGPKKISPFFVPATIINMISGCLSIKCGITGPNISISTACATGLHNIGYAARTIVNRDADIMIAGGSEKGTTPLGIGGFSAARALSTRNEDPKSASRPWDKDRDGFVLGDGAGAVVLEEYECAKKRGANIYAELVGFGMSSDAYHITLPPKNGFGAYLSMKNALQDANISYDKIDYINAHGTSTIAGDKSETESVKRVFLKHAKKVMISSTKSMTGHLLGAAGAVESIFSILSIKNKVIPPTINLENPDKDCDLDYVPKEAREVKNVKYVLCNSFGFGGSNGSLVFKYL